MAGFTTSKPAMLLVCSLLMLRGALRADEVLGTALRGKVLDSARAPISGARIEALGGDGRNANSSTGASGEFLLPLDPGHYTVTITAIGFQTATRVFEVAAGDTATREYVLHVEGQRDSVTVTERAGYETEAIRSATRTPTALRDIPQSVTVVSRELMTDQMMMSVGDVVRYVPGVTSIQGENNRDQVVIRGNSSSADFYRDGVRDDVQYYRDLYNVERVEALKGPHAMAFGRGGGGGVINRVTKEAGFRPLHEISLLGGSFGNKRVTADLDQPLGHRLALRVNGVYENSGSYRDFVSLKRNAWNPTLTFAATDKTRITLGFERLRDDRVADRGIPSFQGRPLDVAPSTYFGDPKESHVGARINIGTIGVEHQAGRVTIRNRTSVGDYDRGYQNFVPGAVTANRSLVALSAYNNATRRRNIFSQTDLLVTAHTGAVRHTLLAGVEVGRQLTNNFRNTGYFNNTATSLSVPLANSVIASPVTWRQSATDADNRLTTTLGAVYVQDQIELSRYVQVTAGLRFEHFDLRYRNNRTSEKLRRIDHMPSPRAGIIFKPADTVSFYGSYGVSHLPGSGDQFSSLTTITQQVKPEGFVNYEAGVKWDVRRGLSLTAAVYRLDRTNTRATDPNDATRIVQTGSQRTSGFEVGWNGSVTRWWQVAGGYSWQDAFVSSATVSARAGAQVAQAPHHSFSLWNQFQVLPRLSAGLGILNRADMFAAIDNTVTLPGYRRADAAVFYSLTERTRVQFNVENLLDKKYYINADGNNNISPGSPRALRVGLVARF